jgi:hypothetical protein
MTESQTAFEAKFPAMIFDMYTPTMYKDASTETCFVYGWRPKPSPSNASAQYHRGLAIVL